jgi:putative ABC transport system substrate-binding protein
MIARRQFITALGVAVAWPLVARAQPAGKPPTIGFIGSGTLASQRTWLEAFVQRLRELGWIEGRTVTIVYRWGEGRAERYAEIAAEFVRLKVDVIIGGGTEAAIAAKRATSEIPIVFPSTGDPVGTGVVLSLARPGGNATGLSNLGTDLAGKRLEILREVFPALRQLATMVNAEYSGGVTETGELQAAARPLGLELVPFPIRHTEDIAAAFEALQGRAQALYVTGDPLLHAHRLRISTLALAARLPTMLPHRDYVEAAGLMSYGVNFPALHRRAAELVDKILRSRHQPHHSEGAAPHCAAAAARPRRRGDRVRARRSSGISQPRPTHQRPRQRLVRFQAAQASRAGLSKVQSVDQRDAPGMRCRLFANC